MNVHDRPRGRAVGGPGSGADNPVPMDAYRRGDDVWVHLDLPGVDPDAVEINLDRNVLTVSASRTHTSDDPDERYLEERPQGTFRRQVRLGEGLDGRGIDARYRDGVLTLRIPVARRATPRKIPVSLGPPAGA